MSAPFVLTNASFFLASLEFANRINRIDLGAQVEAVDTTNFKSRGFKQSDGALRSAEWSFDGFWSSDTDAADAILSGAVGVGGTPVLAVPGDAEPGAVAYAMAALQTTHKWGMQIGAAMSVSVQLRGHKPMVRGRVLTAGTATASGTSAGLLLGAVPTGRRLFYSVHVPEAAGVSPTLDVAIESDASNAFTSPATRATVPQFTAPGSAWGFVAGPITDAWFRAVLTAGGTDPAFRPVVFLGIL